MMGPRWFHPGRRQCDWFFSSSSQSDDLAARTCFVVYHKFAESENEYLASCREDGIEPVKPFSGRLSLRLGSALHQRVAQASAESGVSVNRWISQALEEQLGR